MSKNIPLFIIRYWGPRQPQDMGCKLLHAVFYNEDDLLTGVRNIQGNYTVYTVGKEYESKEYFDKIFKDKDLAYEKKQFEILKAKFEPDDKG